jgi:ribosomal protein S18 acetylase RimI-like enzyme
VRIFRNVDGGARFLDAEGTLGFVAMVDDDIAGWCWGQHIVRPDDTSMLYLHELEVSEPFRRRGQGRALVQAFMAAGRELGASRMFLTTGEANQAARTLYESLGAGLAEQGPTVSYWFLIAP